MNGFYLSLAADFVGGRDWCALLLTCKEAHKWISENKCVLLLHKSPNLYNKLLKSGQLTEQLVRQHITESKLYMYYCNIYRSLFVISGAESVKYIYRLKGPQCKQERDIEIYLFSYKNNHLRHSNNVSVASRRTNVVLLVHVNKEKGFVSLEINCKIIAEYWIDPNASYIIGFAGLAEREKMNQIKLSIDLAI